jgi:hypothetical protein
MRRTYPEKKSSLGLGRTEAFEKCEHGGAARLQHPTFRAFCQALPSQIQQVIPASMTHRLPPLNDRVTGGAA